MSPTLKYVDEELDIPFPPTPQTLQLDFWPSSSHTTTNTRMFDTLQRDSLTKDTLRDPFSKIACNKAKESWNPLQS